MKIARNILSIYLVAMVLLISLPNVIQVQAIQDIDDLYFSPRVVNTQVVNVTPVKQAKIYWCWAACAEMAGKTVYLSSNLTQWDVVKHIKGTTSEPYPDVTGNIGESAMGSAYVAYYSRTFKGVYSKWNFSQIANSLYKKYPIQAAGGYYDSENERHGGHVVVIYMTEEIETATSSEQYIYYIDPADGKSYKCTYTQFCDGSFNGRRYDQTAYVVP